MRERRRKLRKSQETADQGGERLGQVESDEKVVLSSSTPTTMAPTGSPTDELRQDTNNDSDEGRQVVPTTTSSSSSSYNNNDKLITKIMDGKLFVLVPSELSAKDARKFRKDARRTLRNDYDKQQQKDDTGDDAAAVGDDGNNSKKTKKRRLPKVVGGVVDQITDDMLETIEFVTVEEMPSMGRLLEKYSNKKIKTSSSAASDDGVNVNGNGKKFPSIKQLLQEKRLQAEQEKQQAKIQSKLDAIPDSVKQQYVAMDCEMVGIGTDGVKSALARVSIVDWNLQTLLDKYVQVPIRVTDFRTHVSGVEPKHIQKRTGAISPDECRKIVADILKNKTLVGHALSNDLKALLLTHPKSQIRDTAKYRPFQQYRNNKWRPRKLRDLVKENLIGYDTFQQAEHDSTEDAKASMKLFQCVMTKWEKSLSNTKS